MPKAQERRKQRAEIADYGRRLSEHSSGSAALKMPQGLRMFDPKKGAYEIDVIGFVTTKNCLKFKRFYAGMDRLYPEITFFTHGGIGADRERVVCPAKSFGKPCPVCEERQELFTQPVQDKKALQALKASERQLWLVYDRGEPRAGLQLWEISNWCFGKQLDEKINNASPKKKETYKKYFDPEEGLTLRVIGTDEALGDGAGKYVKFGVDEFLERESPVPDEILDHGIDLSTIPIEMSYEKLKKIFLMGADEAEDKRAGKPSANGRAAKDETEEEEEEEETEDDDDPEEEEESEESEEEAVTLAIGCQVEFEYKNKTKQGTVVKLNAKKELAEVEVEGQEKNSVVAYGDLTVLVEETADEEEEAVDEDTDSWNEDAEEEEEVEDVEEDEPSPKKKVKKVVPKKRGR